MPSLRINRQLKRGLFFLTCTVINWIDIFTKEEYFQILLDSLKFYLQKYNGKLFGYVFMTNHIHLIIQCDDLIKFINSFKTFTSKEIKQQLISDNRKHIGDLINKGSGVWVRSNSPKIIETEAFFQQKLEYIHENPVRKGFVSEPNEWKYSSARNCYNDDDTLIYVVRDLD